MKFRFPFNWYNKFGTIPSEFREAMSYEEQILWLCQAHEDLQEQFDSFKVSIDDLEIRIENLEGAIVNKQDKLTAGENIYLFGNDIFAELNYDLSEDIVSGSYIDLSGELYSEVTMTPVTSQNTSYISLNVKEDDFFLMRGTFTLARLDFDNIMQFKYEENVPSDSFSYYKATAEGKLVVSWYDTDQNQPYFAQNVSAEYVINNFGKIPDWVLEENTSFVTSISSSSTDNEVPSAKAVYEALGGGGSSSYTDLSDKPSINGVTLSGDLSTSQLGINEIKVLNGDTFNVWNLENGIYLVMNNSSTTLMAGDITIPVGIADDSCLLFVYGASSIIPKCYMLLRTGSNNYRPSFEVGYCTDENTGTRITQSGDALSFNVNQVNVMTDLTTAVPTEHSVKGYVDSVVGDIATILNNINVGSGVQ